MESIQTIAQNAKKAASDVACISTQTKNQALQLMAEEIVRSGRDIEAANEKDLATAKDMGLVSAMIDRLRLDSRRIQAMADGLKVVASLPDPVGQLLGQQKRPNGLLIKKVRVPIGVIAIIYESRPNVTADAAGLCLKSGNVVILRGGKEALYSNQAIADCMIRVLETVGIAKHAIQIIRESDRAIVNEMLTLDEYIDLVIPRGGEGLIRAVAARSRIPVLKHYKGVCHLFLDKNADEKKAERIVINAKCQRPGVCNAIETLLIHQDLSADIVGGCIQGLIDQDVELRGDDKMRALFPQIKPANEDDWYAEYLEKILAVRMVADVDEAIAHINHYGSRHSDGIITEDEVCAERFVQKIDAAVVYVNASTRFTDGGEFGMGAEMGISTDKLHARGPVGLEELTTYKYVVQGTGQIRE